MTHQAIRLYHGMSASILTLPTLLTLFRMLALIPLIALLEAGTAAAAMTAIGLYISMAISDFLDGFIARRFDQATPLGRILDPVADKVVVAVLLSYFLASGLIDGIHVIAVLLILAREILIGGLREQVSSEGIIVHVSKLAKWKTTVQLIAVGAYLVVPVVAEATLAAHAILWLAAALTVITGSEYTVQIIRAMAAKQPAGRQPEESES